MASSSKVDWLNPLTRPPECFTDVLIAIIDEPESEQAILLRDGSWLLPDGHSVAASSVYGWTPMPANPKPEEVAS